MNTQLKLFSEPWITNRVPRQTFIDLFVRLIPFLPCKSALPNPRPDNDGFPGSLANVLGGANDLPPEVLQVFADIEALAAPEKQPIDNPELDIDLDAPEPCRLRNAIRQWLAADRVNGKQTDGQQFPSRQPSPAATGKAGEGSGELATGKTSAVCEANGEVVLVGKSPNGAAVGSATTMAPGETPGSLAGETAALQGAGAAKEAESDTSVFARLARLAPSEYDRVREKEAHRLHLRVRTLDTQVARERARLEMEEQTKTIHLETFEPWPEPVNGAQVLNEILVRFNLYAFMPPGAAVAGTLWTGHVPVFDAFHLTPRLNLTSEIGGCGKTTVLDLITALVSRALRFESLTPAVLFRIINLLAPVLLLDEVDTYLPQNDELRGLLNAGHKRNSHAYRCEGERYTIRAFKAFAPAVLAGIGELPGTLRDRSITIHMTPAPAGQQLARFDPLHLEIETILARKLARWAKDNFAALAACDPPLPPTAFNRLADNWRPLFAVAQVAGGDWPALALDAFNQLTIATRSPSANGASSTHPIPPHTVRLLADIRRVFRESGAQRIFSTRLVSALIALNGSFPDNHGHPQLTELHLARLLRNLAVRPHNIRIGAERAKGYELADFADTFSHFLADDAAIWFPDI